ncbi:MAG: hypothetical protein KY468_17635, partial [Armatimonadetes bacterium]|nr:hypothetical protein [Armatimonadota bacterium]
MKAASESVLSSIEEAYRNPSLSFPLKVGPTRTQEEALQRVAESGESVAVPYILPLLLSPSEGIARAAARAVHRLMARVPPGNLPAFDDWLRTVYLFPYDRNFGNSDWNDLRPEGVSTLIRFPEETVSLLGAASGHRSGHVREAALRLLAEVHDGSELPFLLVRLNDWVGPIRRAAREAVEERLNVRYAPHLVRNLELVFRIRDWQRASCVPYAERAADILKSPEGREWLIRGLDSRDRAVRRLCFELALETPGLNVRDTLLQALRQKYDQTLPLWAARQASSRLEGEDLRAVLPVMWGHRSAGVREEALLLYRDRLPGEAEEILYKALMDSHPDIRQR